MTEQHGFHSVWTAEHRLWYDGWCPAPLHVEAFAAMRTRRIRFGNAMLLLPQHDPLWFARSVATLHRLSGGRVDLGVGLGYRDPEFDALGLRRDRRGALMDAALDTISAVWAGERGDVALSDPLPRVWVGGMAPKALERAARHGHSLMLPQTLSVERIRAIARQHRDRAAGAPLIGTMRDVWIVDDERRAREMRERIVIHYREEAGSWWTLGGSVGFAVPDRLDRQGERTAATAAVGSAAAVAAALDDLFEAGVDLVVARLSYGFVEPAALHDQIARLALEVAPLLAVGEAVA